VVRYGRLTARRQTTAPAKEEVFSNNWGLLVIYVVAFIAIFYFLAIRPQQRQRRSHDALVSAAKKGDKIVTAGGIFGKIKKVEEDSVILEVAKGVEIRIARRAIAEVVNEDQSQPAALPAKGDEEDTSPEPEEAEETAAEADEAGDDTPETEEETGR
jgi:preprotein translocase subunit YajC